MSLVGTGAPPVAAPLVLRHAALRRLALPNFCLKLNLKEKKNKKPETKKAGSLFYWTFHLLPEVRGEGAGSGTRGRCFCPAPPPACRRGGPGTNCDRKPAAPSFLSRELAPQTDGA